MGIVRKVPIIYTPPVTYCISIYRIYNLAHMWGHICEKYLQQLLLGALNDRLAIYQLHKGSFSAHYEFAITHFISTFASVTRPIVKEHRSTRPTQRSHHVGFGSWRRKNWCFFRTKKKNSRIGNLMDIETHKLQSFSCLPVIHLKAFASTTS